MSVKFKLDLTIEGSSLSEIDDQLAHAAGERLRARLSSPLQMPTVKAGEVLPTPPMIGRGQVLPKGAEVPSHPMEAKGWEPKQVPIPAPVEAAINKATDGNSSVTRKRGPGRPPNKPKVQNETKSQEIKAPQETKSQVSEAPKAQASESTQTPTQEEVVGALSGIFQKYGMPKAQEALARFGISKARELPEGSRIDFIKHCNDVVTGVVTG